MLSALGNFLFISMLPLSIQFIDKICSWGWKQNLLTNLSLWTHPPLVVLTMSRTTTLPKTKYIKNNCFTKCEFWCTENTWYASLCDLIDPNLNFVWNRIQIVDFFDPKFKSESSRQNWFKHLKKDRKVWNRLILIENGQI